MTERNRGRTRRWFVHAVRAVLFAAIVGLIHFKHRQLSEAARIGFSSFEPGLEDVARLMPDAAALGEWRDAEGRTVLDADGIAIGFVIRTSPLGDSAIGFSGPTNVLLAFRADETLIGMHILDSQDTRDHVRQVEQDERFMSVFNDLTWDEVAALEGVDGVTGATLTSLAMVEAVKLRLGAARPAAESSRFPGPPSISDVRVLYPQAAEVFLSNQRGLAWEVLDERQQHVGWLLRTVPPADDVIGYQGPTETLAALAEDRNTVTGLAIGRSFDNEPYVGYVREESYFLELFNGKTIDELSELDLESSGVEGVSGATMTSQMVAEGLFQAAREQLHLIQRAAAKADQPEPRWFPSLADIGTTVVVLAGLTMSMTSLRGKRWLRLSFLIVLVGYLGLINGALVSQAMWVGWAQNGIPFRAASGLVILSFAALAVPLVSKQNIYCHQLCPHGAAQQLLKHRLPWRLKVPKKLGRVLETLPVFLLAWVVIVAMTGWPFNLVDIEPFDAYVWWIAGWATISIAVIGLVASLFVPMAYCRYGCPTGSLIGYLRLHRRSGELTLRDAAAGGLLLLAAVLFVAT